jgi:hypothetical protein
MIRRIACCLPLCVLCVALAGAHSAQARVWEAKSDAIVARYDDASGALDIGKAGAGAPFLHHAQLRGTNGSVSVSGTRHDVFGSGRELTVAYPDGDRDRVLVFDGLPFALVQPLFRNGAQETRNVKAAVPLTGTLGAAASADALKAWGTAGLTAVDKHPGSYVFLALADPESRNGVVAAWLTQDRGSGIVFSGRDGDAATLKAQIDYGRLLVEPDAEAAGEMLAVGWFDDVRLGLEQWADLVARYYGIKLRPQVDGYCTWYSNPHGGAADEKAIVELAEFAARDLKPFGFKFVQIDDQWQDGKAIRGPKKVFTRHNPNGPYPNGMKAPADRIRDLGLMPGLWFMPFAGDHDEPFFADKQAWFAKRPDGAPYTTPWGGTSMDMTNPEARDYLAGLVRRIAHEWGYQYFKMDGMWMGTGTKQTYVNNGYQPNDDLGVPTVHDPKMTPIEAYRSGLKLIREAAGPEVFILGCCVSQNMRSFGGTFGLVDAMRIGPDNGASLDGLRAGPWHAGNRYFLNGRVWYNDPDPVYVRPGLPLEASRLICSWVGISGDLHASSEWLPAIPPERLELLKRILPSHGKLARPVDILEKEMAEIWLLSAERGGEPVHVVGLYNWDESKPLAIRRPMAKTDLDAKTTYVGFDFWANRFVPPFSGELRADLPAYSCRVLALRPEAKRPQVVSTSRHITQGIADLASETWDAGSGVLSGVSRAVAGDPYELRIVSPAGASSWVYESAEASAGAAALAVGGRQDGPQLRVVFTPAASGDVSWRVKFKRGPVETPVPAKPAGLKAETGFRRANLRWEGSDALGYRVTRDDGAAWQVATPAFRDDSVKPGARHAYKVAARGWSDAWSEAATVEVEVPEKLTLPPLPPAPEVNLGDLKPLSQHAGWGSVQMNRSVEGKPLTIGGKVHEKGVGTHANSLIVFAIPPGMKRFVAAVGLDDEKNDDPRASVVFKVFGDVKEMGEPPELIAESPVLSDAAGVRSWSFDVPISGRHRELRLVVEDAGDGIACDHADWVDAGFIKGDR